MTIENLSGDQTPDVIFFYEAATLNRRLLIHRRQFIIPRSSFPAPLEPFNHRYDRSYVSFPHPEGKPPPHQALLRRCNIDTKRRKYRIRRKFLQTVAKKKKRYVEDGVVSASLTQ